jgi:hypothetical protein
MISRPSTGQLLQTVRDELLESVAPAVNDKSLSVTIEMMGEVLLACANACDHEVGWMRTEIDGIIEAASGYATAHPDIIELRRALDAYQARPPAVGIDELRGDYECASEVLSCFVEVALRDSDPDARATADRLMSERLAHETEIIGGSFRAVGRT